MKTFRSAAATMLLVVANLGYDSRSSAQATGISSPADSASNYLPLQIGNAWHYYYDEGIPVPDSTIHLTYTIDDTVSYNGKLYFRYLESGGLVAFYRTDGDHVYRWFENRDILWFDLALAVGDTHRLQFGGSSTTYVMILSKTDIVETHAGTFTGCYHVVFDEPQTVDNAVEYWLAPNVCIVKMIWPHNIRPTLHSARVDGQDYPGPAQAVDGVDHSKLPGSFFIHAAYPNPFTLTTK